MNNDDHKAYHRMLNAGGSMWELDAPSEPVHPVFARAAQAVPNAETLTTGSGARTEPLPQDFLPEGVYIEWLQQHYGIPPAFTLEQLPDFKLYWLETGEARKAWQNKFKNHVIYQWKRKQSEREQNPHRTTAEKLTDTSWSDSLDI
ncbi:DnaT-like ssDNA-binding domain-containing protein [Aestuariirhabdus sp. LZHN29]|uniref:DnaT-like ssDNA-binding domain-containing protein n=1 Tax=Aestuariirhabdus sp. LZHN29 TaxID=3417462 RepID=UPI003CEF4E83